jgi:hypothetical protein
MAENGKVIVTGCMGAEPEKIKQSYPAMTSRIRPNNLLGHKKDTTIDRDHATSAAKMPVGRRRPFLCPSFAPFPTPDALSLARNS